jgi:hypothetical protein
MLDTIIPILILILTGVGITKLNKKTRPEYVKNYSFKRDFIRENKKLVFWFCLVLFLMLRTHC